MNHEKVKEAWRGRPDRNCGTAEWNAWCWRMDRAMEAEPPEPITADMIDADIIGQELASKCADLLDGITVGKNCCTIADVYKIKELRDKLKIIAGKA